MKKLIKTFGLMAVLILSSSIFAESTTSEGETLAPNPNVPNDSKANDVNAVFVFNRVCYGVQDYNETVQGHQPHTTF